LSVHSEAKRANLRSVEIKGGASYVRERRGEGTVGVWAVATAILLVPLVVRAGDAPVSPETVVREELNADVERARSLDARAEGLRAEIDSLRSTLVELADALRARETELDDVEARIRSLEAEERERVDKAEVERARMATVLSALVGAARLPPEAALARSGDSLDVLRSLGALRDIAAPLRERAEAAEAVIRDLRATRTALGAERDRAREARAALDARRAEVERLVRRREDLSRMTTDERVALARRMAALVDRVTDLRQLVERVERDRRDEAPRAEPRKPAPPASEPIQAPAQIAALPVPVPRRDVAPPSDASFPRTPIGGRIVVRFGQPDAFGGIARGVTLVGRPGGPVTSPGDGRIAFAGPFKGHGLVLIVDHGNGYHSLIAGLGRVDISVGRAVAVGEPIGILPDGEGETPELYFELRRDGKPTNPQRGLSAPETKGRG